MEIAEWRVYPDLLQADLRNANLRGADLSNANLSYADLRLANLSGANLFQATLFGANLTEADLRGADFGEGNLNQAILDRVHHTERSINRAVLEGASFKGATLTGTMFIDSSLARADFTEANLERARFDRATLDNANFTRAQLRGANFTGASMIGTILDDANLSESIIYGSSVWDLKTSHGTKQDSLIITRPGDPEITVDNIKVAQFIYLLLNNEEIRGVIDTITSKAVLILGRFSDDRKPIRNALRNALRAKGFLPIVFDFERPRGRDFTETIMTLAGMSCFVIADITNPRSAPLELQATVPDYMIPFVPILQEGELEFSMFSNLQAKYHWVLDVLGYNSSETLIEVLDEAVINPALKKRYELEQLKMQNRPMRHVDDYRKRIKPTS